MALIRPDIVLTVVSHKVALKISLMKLEPIDRAEVEKPFTKEALKKTEALPLMESKKFDWLAL